MATSQNVDFSNVKEGGNFNKKRIPSGDYLATVTKIDDAKAKDDVFQYLVSIKINKLSGSVFPYYCKLQENQLWKLRNLLIAGGLTVPKKRMKIDPNRIVGRQIGVTIEDAEYEGKEQSEIAAVFPAAELADGGDDGDEPEDEEPEDEDAPLEDDEPEEEPEAEEEAEEEEEAAADNYDELDRTALKALLRDNDSTFVAKKSQSDDDLRALLREFVGGADADEELEEDEPEAAPVVAKKAAVTRKVAAKKPAAKPAATVSDEELEELDIDNL